MAVIGQFLQRFGAGARFGVAAVCGLALMTVPVLGQYGGRGQSFDSFFSPYSAPRYQVERSTDSSRAPSPRRPDVQPTGGSVLVLGDSMADWLAYGLEDALGDPPDLAVVRKNRAGSGLIRYDSRNEREDWVQVIRETIAATRPKFVVMTVGLNDRVPIRDRVAQSTQPAGAAAKTPVRPPRPPRNNRRLRPTQNPRPRTLSRRRASSRGMSRPSRRPEAASPPRPIASTNSGPMNGPPRTPSGSMRRSPR